MPSIWTITHLWLKSCTVSLGSPAITMAHGSPVRATYSTTPCGSCMILSIDRANTFAAPERTVSPLSGPRTAARRRLLRSVLRYCGRSSVASPWLLLVSTRGDDQPFAMTHLFFMSCPHNPRTWHGAPQTIDLVGASAPQLGDTPQATCHDRVSPQVASPSFETDPKPPLKVSGGPAEDPPDAQSEDVGMQWIAPDSARRQYQLNSGIASRAHHPRLADYISVVLRSACRLSSDLRISLLISTNV